MPQAPRSQRKFHSGQIRGLVQPWLVAATASSSTGGRLPSFGPPEPAPPWTRRVPPTPRRLQPMLAPTAARVVERLGRDPPTDRRLRRLADEEWETAVRQLEDRVNPDQPARPPSAEGGHQQKRRFGRLGDGRLGAGRDGRRPKHTKKTRRADDRLFALSPVSQSSASSTAQV